MDVATKREREKEVVSLMISLYCRKKHGGKTLCRNVQRWMITPEAEATAAPLWRPRPFAPIAGCIAIKRICGRKSGRSCAFPDHG